MRWGLPSLGLKGKVDFKLDLVFKNLNLTILTLFKRASNFAEGKGARYAVEISL